MASLTPYTNVNTLTPADMHAVDMDRRADWAETDEDNPSFILNKPDVADPSSVPNLPSAPAKASAAKTYLLKVKADGSLEWVESAVYSG